MSTRVKGSTWNALDNLQYANVKDYLAAGDGTTDDTTAIVNALAAADAVYFPPGTYLTSTVTLTAGKILFGVGALSIIKLKAGTNSHLISIGAVSGVQITRLKLDGNKSANTGTSHGVYINNSTNTVLSDLAIINTVKDGVNVTGGATGTIISNAAITGFIGNGITLGNSSFTTIETVQAYSSDVTAFPGDGISLAADAVGSSVSATSITGCISRSNAGRGFSFVGNGSKNVTNVCVSACVAQANSSHGFHALTAQQINISSSIARSNTVDGYRLEGDVQYCNVTGCVSDTNTSFGCREIVSGSTPNRNNFAGVWTIGNGTNTVTKVGANSQIPY
jgi:hypothetical protein